jgi:integrase
VARKAKVPQRDAIRPLPTAVVERLREQLGQRDATLVAVLAYAGLRPGEALDLRWGHVQDRTLIVNAPKTGRRRTVRLLAPLAADWRRGAQDLDDRQRVDAEAAIRAAREASCTRLVPAVGVSAHRPSGRQDGESPTAAGPSS